MIYGERIRQARELLGETQTVFGDEVGIAQSALSDAERSIGPLPESLVANIADHTGFPTIFFERPPTATVDEYQFRARLRFKAADRQRAIRSAEVVHESFDLMRREASKVRVRIPDLTGVDPRVAAATMRDILGVHPHAPIPNLLLPIERAGVVVLALPLGAQKHDAFAWWDRSDVYPVIAVLPGAPGDRLRWSVAHELGHVVLHRQGGGSAEIEQQADAFAAELLTPLAALRSEMPASPKLSALYAMKARWGVAVQSLIRRARELGAIDDHQYTSLFKQISARGERMNERYQIRREKPRAYRKMAEALFGDRPTEGLADLAAWTPSFTDDVLAGFAARGELPHKRVALPGRPGLAPVVPLRRR